MISLKHWHIFQFILLFTALLKAESSSKTLGHPADASVNISLEKSAKSSSILRLVKRYQR